MVIKGNKEAQKEKEKDMKTTDWNVPSM